MRAQPNSARSSMAASSICRRGSRRAGRACARRSRPRRWANWRPPPRVRRRISSSTTSSSIRSFPTPTRSSASASTMPAMSARSAGNCPPCPAFSPGCTTPWCRHGGNIVRPRASIDFDFEGELAIVIGERCRHVLAGQRALGRGGLHLLPRHQRARLPEALGDGRQELPGDRAARTVDGDGRRDRRPAAARAHDAAERQRPCSTTRPIT